MRGFIRCTLCTPALMEITVFRVPLIGNKACAVLQILYLSFLNEHAASFDFQGTRYHLEAN